MALWETLFLAADIWMIVIGFWFGVRFIRNYGNYLIGLEWIVMGTSGTNFMIFALLQAGPESPMFHIAWFFDAFSRSIGFTLILVLGLLKVTHRFKPSIGVDVGAFALAAVLGFILSEYATELGVGGKVFFLVAAVATSGFLYYFAARLWSIGARTHAWSIGVVTSMNVVIASIYDFWHLPGDDAMHTVFYMLALFTWGLAMAAIYYAYAAFDAHNKRVDARGDSPVAAEPSLLR